MERCNEEGVREKNILLHTERCMSSGSSGSDSGSTEEEERLRRLFTSCDRDGDGFIDNHDLRYMCQQLNLEEAVDEIMLQLGVDEKGKISFQDFMQCRQRLTNEIEEEKLRVDSSGAWVHTDSENSSGMPASSGDYDSGARDMSPEPPSVYTLMEKHNPEYLQQVMNTQYGPAILEVTNSLHLAALTSLKSELLELNTRYQKLGNEKEIVDRQLAKYRTDNIRLQEEYGDRLEEQTRRYEDRITELHSVIAELRKKLDHKQFNVIREEDETEDISDGVKSQISQGSISVNENLSLNDSLSLNNDSNTNQSFDNELGASDWEADMSQVINTFNKALLAQQQKIEQQQQMSARESSKFPQHTSNPTSQSPQHTSNPISQSPQHTGNPISQFPHHTSNPVSQIPQHTGNPVSQFPQHTSNPVSQFPQHTSNPVSQFPHNTGNPVSQFPHNTGNPVSQFHHNTGNPVSQSRDSQHYTSNPTIHHTCNPTTQSPHHTSSPTSQLPYHSNAPGKYQQPGEHYLDHKSTQYSTGGTASNQNADYKQMYTDSNYEQQKYMAVSSTPTQNSISKEHTMGYSCAFGSNYLSPQQQKQSTHMDTTSPASVASKQLSQKQGYVNSSEALNKVHSNSSINSSSNSNNNVSSSDRGAMCSGYNVISSASNLIPADNRVTGGGAAYSSSNRTVSTSVNSGRPQPVFTTPPYSQLRSTCQQQQQQPSVHSSQNFHRDSLPATSFTSPLHQTHENSAVMQEIPSLKEQISRLESELHHTHKKLHSVNEDRNKLKDTVQNLQSKIHGTESPSDSVTGTPTKLTRNSLQNRSSSDIETGPSVPKMAALKKLKIGDQIFGVDITSSLANTKVAEHLVQSLQESSSIQEIVHAAGNTHHSTISENKVHEFEIEVERLQSKIDNLKAQNELLAIALDESKGHCDRMTELVGQCESNQTALHLAVGIGDQLVEAMDSIISLLDSEQILLLANCKAAGIGSTATTDSGMGDESSDELTDIIGKAKTGRKSTEQTAKQLLLRLDRVCGSNTSGSNSQTQSQTGVTSPWEELSSTSRTTSTTSSVASSGDTEFSKLDEQRLREYIRHLKQERTAVKLTVLELESVHIDPQTDKPAPLQEGQRLDLENAVLMQELMALKEEKAELRAENYLVEKEKAALELQIFGKESQEQAYIVQIEHLKSEITEWQQKLGHDVTVSKDEDTATPSITLVELKSMGMDSSQMAQDLADSLKREQLLRKRVSELMATLERLSKNSETRHKQSAEFVNDLKNANSALVSAFEKTKKKYQSKLKKIELHFQEATDKYEAKIAALKEKKKQDEENSSAQPSNKTENVDMDVASASAVT